MGNGSPSSPRTKKVNSFQAKFPPLYQSSLTSCTSWCRMPKRFERKKNMSMKLVKETSPGKIISTSLRCCFLHCPYINCQKVYLQIVVLLQVPLKKQKNA